MVGQDHVTVALRNAVRNDKVAHAYLFSGPRGTGKTSAARILAKALNCANPTDGEPDGTCESCKRIQAGNSLDVHELDAASNNGVDAMRDLVSRASLGTPGRWKVYIVDEVHMLSTAASNALLKTLEEPPGHVVFVLATTDPQKVLPTIRSRTQHFEFRLLAPEALAHLVRDINNKANLQMPDQALDLVIRRGKGSARDALSALDQVAAAGIVDDETEIIDEIVESLADKDTGRAMRAVAEGCNAGRDPQRMAVDLLEHLRNGFLAMMSKSLVPLSDAAIERVEAQARRLGAPALVRAMEAIGDALQQMRDAPEQRITLEVALVRLTKDELSVDSAMLLERIERLERGGNTPPSGGAPTTHHASVPEPGPAPQASPAPQRPTSAPDAQARAATAEPAAQRPAPSDGPKPALGALRKQQRPAAQPQTQQQAPKPAAPEAKAPAPETPAPAGQFPDRDTLTEAWGDKILEVLPARARSRFRVGRFTTVENGRATFALPNEIHAERCEEVRNEVEAALRGHFGVRVPLQLVVEREQTATAMVEAAADTPHEDDVVDISETIAAEDNSSATPEAALLKAFPGAEEVN